MLRILACGVPRSGSTLVWQVLNMCLPGNNVTKSHPGSWKPTDNVDFIVGSIRDPYDIVTSRFRARVANDDSDGAQEHVTGTRKGLMEDLHMNAGNFDALKMLMRRFGEKVFVLRYEEFFENFHTIFAAVRKHIGITVPRPLRERAKSEFSFAANLKKTLALKPGNDRADRMGLAHLGSGAAGTPGMWKTVIPVWGHAAMRKWCNPLCEEWGYANQ